MKISVSTAIATMLVATGSMLGCSGNPQSGNVANSPNSASSSAAESMTTDPAAIAESLGKLSAEDRALAESQKFCAIATNNPLGTMGTPLKIDVNGEPVFLCCAGCKAKALQNPEDTLASVAKLKAENSASK